MTKSFANYPELTSSLAHDLIDMITAHDFSGLDITAAFGLSNISPSAYVEFSVYGDDGDLVAETKVRFSDHADRYGSDITIRIDDLIVTIEDEGDYVETQISEEHYAEALNRAFVHIVKKAAA
jgi:hypothetical protein